MTRSFGGRSAQSPLSLSASHAVDFDVDFWNEIE